MQSATDHIIQAWQQGSQEAMRTLYEQYNRSLFLVVYRVLQDHQLSEDVLQEAFVKIWNNRHSFDSSKASLYTWMMNICRNQAIDKTRSKHVKRRHQIQTEEKVVYHHSDHQPQPEQIGLKELTEQLLPEQKELIDLVYFGGYTQQEAAEALDIPLGTAKTRIRKGIQTLRKMFT